MMLKQTFIAAAMLLAVSAHAAPVSPVDLGVVTTAGTTSPSFSLPEEGYNFTNSLTFTLNSAAGAQTRFEASFYDWSAIFSNPQYGTLSFPTLTFNIDGVATSVSNATAVVPGIAGTATAYGSFANLGAGQHTLTISGDGVGDNADYGSYYLGTGYTVTVAALPLAPVPEPETYAMLLAGLGLMGSIARNRKNTK